MALSESLTRIWPLTVTVPAGTPPSAPLVVPWVTEDAVITEIEILIPSGPNGTTGIRIMKGDVQLLPWGSGSWIIANDYNRTFPIGGYLPTKDLKVQAYNQGANPHSFYLRMSVSYASDAASASSAATLSPADLGTSTGTTDPLSPDALLGSDTAALLADGTITAADIAPIPPDSVPVVADTFTTQQP
jgi:hypothetical protein